MRILLRVLLPTLGLLPFLSPAASAQLAQPAQHPSSHHAADQEARYHRLICLVHLVGSGKRGDPIRAEYLPAATDATRRGILAVGVQITDDGKMAIIHVVAADRHAFDAIFADKRPEIRVFEIGKDSQATIEAEMQKYKKGFDLTTLEVLAQ
jgi:hypothetical protein